MISDARPPDTSPGGTNIGHEKHGIPRSLIDLDVEHGWWEDPTLVATSCRCEARAEKVTLLRDNFLFLPVVVDQSLDTRCHGIVLVGFLCTFRIDRIVGLSEVQEYCEKGDL